MCVPVLITIWSVIPAFELMVIIYPTGIIGGVCVTMGIYRSAAEEKIVAFLILFVEYLLPLMLMIFCYSRIVYTLRTKVTRHGPNH